MSGLSLVKTVLKRALTGLNHLEGFVDDGQSFIMVTINKKFTSEDSIPLAFKYLEFQVRKEKAETDNATELEAMFREDALKVFPKVRHGKSS